jgi:hypothetical protein
MQGVHTVPTTLPPRRPVPRSHPRPLRDLVLNGLMLVSALALTFVVLVQEQRYALGQPGPLAGVIEQIMQSNAADAETGGMPAADIAAIE